MEIWLRRKIVRDIQKGKGGAYEKLICLNYGYIYNLLVYMTNDATLAEDLTQETFVSAIENISKFEARSTLKTWLYRVAYNKLLDHERKKKLSKNLSENLSCIEGSSSDKEGPLERLVRDEDSAILYKAIRELGVEDHLVIVMHYVQGLNYRQISEITEEPSGTIRWRANRALKKLKMILEKVYDDE